MRYLALKACHYNGPRRRGEIFAADPYWIKGLILLGAVRALPDEPDQPSTPTADPPADDEAAPVRRRPYRRRAVVDADVPS